MFITWRMNRYVFNLGITIVWHKKKTKKILNSTTIGDSMVGSLKSLMLRKMKKTKKKHLFMARLCIRTTHIHANAQKYCTNRNCNWTELNEKWALDEVNDIQQTWHYMYNVKRTYIHIYCYIHGLHTLAPLLRACQWSFSFNNNIRARLLCAPLSRNEGRGIVREEAESYIERERETER